VPAGPASRYTGRTGPDGSRGDARGGGAAGPGAFWTAQRGERAPGRGPPASGS